MPHITDKDRMYNNPERFAAKLDKSAGPDGCWLWTGATNGKGYGVLAVNVKVQYYAHRRAWEFVNGPIPDGLHVLHRCDVTLCCNPAHLSLGTQRDNNLDRDQKGRKHAPYSCGFCAAGHNLRETGIRTWPNGRRKCELCYQRQYNAYNAKKRAAQKAASSLGRQ